MTAVDVADRLYSVQYTGANGTALVAGLIGATLDSDNGSQLFFTTADSVQSLATPGDWVIWYVTANATVIQVLPNAQYAARYRNLTGAAVALAQVTGSAAVPASVLGNAGVNYDIDLSGALPDSGFVPVAVLRGPPTIVSGHSILSVTVLDVDTVRVRVQSAVASLAGASVFVSAYDIV